MAPNQTSIEPVCSGFPLSETLLRVRPSTAESEATAVQNKFESAVCIAKVYSHIQNEQKLFIMPPAGLPNKGLREKALWLLKRKNFLRSVDSSSC